MGQLGASDRAPSDGTAPSGGSTRRGRLRLYVGVAPGAGATCALLDEATRRARRGTRVALGPVTTHDRPETVARLAALMAAVPTSDAHDTRAAGPAAPPTGPAGAMAVPPAGSVAIVDDLAASDDGGVTHRWQLAERLLRGGVDVVGSLSIGDVESLSDIAASLVGCAPAAAVPDRLLKAADQLELVDITPEALRRRLAHGNLYTVEQLDADLASQFEPARLARLREIALEWMADRAEAESDRVRRHSSVAAVVDEDTPAVAVALDGRSTTDAAVRRAARLADRLDARLVGIHVVEPSHDPTADGRHRSAAQEATPAPSHLDRQRQLVVNLGGEVRMARGGDRVGGLVAAAQAAQASQLVVGSGHRVSRRLVRAAAAAGLDLHLVPSGSAGDDGTVRFHVPRTATLAAGLLAAGLAGAALVPLAHDDRIALASLVVATGSAIGALVVARRARQVARRAQADANALAASARTLVTERDPVSALLHEARDALGFAGVAIVAPGPQGPVVEHAVGVPVTLDDASAAADVGSRGLVLIGSGRSLDRRELALLRGFAAQLAAARDHQTLHAEAAHAVLVAESDALRTSILRAVSHDLHTPIAGIKASVTSLRQQDVAFSADERAELLATIDTEADRLHRMVTNLLDVSRLQAGAVTVDCRPSFLEDVVAATLANVAHRSDRIEVSVPETLPPALVDPALLERALANLVANALAWSPVGPPAGATARSTGGPASGSPVRIDAATVTGDDGAPELHVRVIDRGPGIAPGQRERVLQPFQRIGRKSLQAGAGLGLTVVAGFVDALGGRLLLDDTPGGGLTATIVVRAAPADPAPAEPEPNAQPADVDQSRQET